MPVTAVIGSQWGDEGKGKVTDYLAGKADVIVRYQGGTNAGHTITVGSSVFKLKLIPSGILYPGKICLLGNGMVIDPAALLEEISSLKAKGIEISNLYISNRAHVIMPYHRYLDELTEDHLGQDQIGTTRRGIGPAYMDKFSRLGIRVVDLLDRSELERKLTVVLPQKNAILENIYSASAFDLNKLLDDLIVFGQELSPYVADVSFALYNYIEEGKNVLLEGAQGTMLDIDHGTYPFVTSSTPTAGGACAGSGLPPTAIDRVTGVVKAYTTRVGGGPFPSELRDDTGDYIRQKGAEFGTVTGRPRRVGWLDGVIIRYARRINGISRLIITKIDVLSGLKQVAVCTGYEYQSSCLETPPASLGVFERCKPRLEWFPGWEEDISKCQSYDELPSQARDYLEFIEEFVGAKIAIVSVGPGREQTIIREDLFQ